MSCSLPRRLLRLHRRQSARRLGRELTSSREVGEVGIVALGGLFDGLAALWLRSFADLRFERRDRFPCLRKISDRAREEALRVSSLGCDLSLGIAERPALLLLGGTSTGQHLPQRPLLLLQRSRLRLELADLRVEQLLSRTRRTHALGRLLGLQSRIRCDATEFLHTCRRLLRRLLRLMRGHCRIRSGGRGSICSLLILCR